MSTKDALLTALLNCGISDLNTLLDLIDNTHFNIDEVIAYSKDLFDDEITVNTLIASVFDMMLEQTIDHFDFDIDYDDFIEPVNFLDSSLDFADDSQLDSNQKKMIADYMKEQFNYDI